MNLIDLSLTHRCSIAGERTETGKDRYNRPLYSYGPDVENIPCFFSPSTKTTTDDDGESYVRTITLLISKRAALSEKSIIKNIRMGNIVLPGVYEVVMLKPVSGYTALSHYEAMLKEV